MRRFVCALAVLACSCRSLEITPSALREPGGREADRAAAIVRWQEAVDLANAFLVSPYRRTLPPGRFDLTERGMAFVLDGSGRAWPIGVFSSTWGDLVVWTGFQAQEDEDGFVVGGTPGPAGAPPDPLLDHTWFRYRSGDEELPVPTMARLLLHETTHVVYRHGTVGAWPTVRFYVVAVATLSSAKHPDEDRPRATNEEFAWFQVAAGTPEEYRHVIDEQMAEHLATPRPHCEHGPFECR